MFPSPSYPLHEHVLSFLWVRPLLRARCQSTSRQRSTTCSNVAQNESTGLNQISSVQIQDEHIRSAVTCETTASSHTNDILKSIGNVNVAVTVFHYQIIAGVLRWHTVKTLTIMVFVLLTGSWRRRDVVCLNNRTTDGASNRLCPPVVLRWTQEAFFLHHEKQTVQLEGI